MRTINSTSEKERPAREENQDCGRNLGLHPHLVKHSSGGVDDACPVRKPYHFGTHPPEARRSRLGVISMWLAYVAHQMYKYLSKPGKQNPMLSGSSSLVLCSVHHIKEEK